MKPKNKRRLKKFEISLIIIIILLLAVVAWQFMAMRDNSSDSSSATVDREERRGRSAEDVSRSDAESNGDLAVEGVADPYEGWFTHTTNMGTGLAFKYPPSWILREVGQEPATNLSGGQSLDTVVYSADPSSGGQYLCLSIGEYTSHGWSRSDYPSGDPTSAHPLNINGQSVDFGFYVGPTPMQSELLIHNPGHVYGIRNITTKEGYTLRLAVGFNDRCQQSYGKAEVDLNADFMSQPDVAIAKKVIESITW